MDVTTLPSEDSLDILGRHMAPEPVAPWPGRLTTNASEVTCGTSPALDPDRKTSRRATLCSTASLASIDKQRLGPASRIRHPTAAQGVRDGY